MDWTDDPDSRVDILATALADLRGIVRVGCGLTRGTIKVPELREARAAGGSGRTGELAWQIAGFGAIGVASTLAYIILYLLLRNVLPAAGRQPAQPAGHRRRPTPPLTAG